MRGVVAAVVWIVLMGLSYLVVALLGMDMASTAATVYFTGMSVTCFLFAKVVYLVLGPVKPARSRR